MKRKFVTWRFDDHPNYVVAFVTHKETNIKLQVTVWLTAIKMTSRIAILTTGKSWLVKRMGEIIWCYRSSYRTLNDKQG